MSHNLAAQLEHYWRHHRQQGILLDTNLLVLLWLATFDAQLVGGKRLEKYTPNDVQLLRGYVGRFNQLLTTSTILTETSNLIGQVLKGHRRQTCFTTFFNYFNSPQPSQFQRYSIEGLTLNLSVFNKLGFTDSSLIAVGQKAGLLLLTDDLDLYLTAQQQGQDAINFTHMQEAYGLL